MMSTHLSKKYYPKRRKYAPDTFSERSFASKDNIISNPAHNPVTLSYIVPTFGRPDGLRKALDSLLVQTINVPAEIIIADNHPDATAKKIATDYILNHPGLIHYIHVRQPGVANARNAALKHAKGRYLAFLDDDQIATPNWAEMLLKTSQKFDAGLVFCPTQARSHVNSKYKETFLEFFSRQPDHTTTQLIETFYGCGNSLMDREKCSLPSPVFCPSTNDTGGEDDKLFSHLLSNGTKAAWSNKTHALEDVDPHRMTKSYIQKRSFAYGQGPSRLCVKDSKTNYLCLMKWTVIGSLQMAVYTPLYIGASLFRSDKSIWYMRKAVEGAGKVFWFKAFRPRLYGAAMLK